MKNIFKYGMMAFVAAAAVSSCDWTDPEPVDVKYDQITEADPDAYQQYLANLRAYRNNGHKKVYAWFDNKSSFASQAHHVSAVPDSIDVLVLTAPHAISQATLDEINEKRSNTGMQMAYVVDYATIRKAWDLKKELETPEAPVKEWSVFLADSVEIAMGYFNNGGFDRIIASYNGKDMNIASDSDKEAYRADQENFLKPFVAWKKAQSDKGFDFIGIPANVLDASFFDNVGVIFLSESKKATNVNELSFLIGRNSVAGVPTNRFAMFAALPVLDETQASVGFWGDKYSAWETARWTRTADGVTAMGMTNLADNYYHPTFIYPVCRQAIQILNPAAR